MRSGRLCLQPIPPIVERIAKEFGIVYNENSTFFWRIDLAREVVEEIRKTVVLRCLNISLTPRTKTATVTLRLICDFTSVYSVFFRIIRR